MQISLSLIGQPLSTNHIYKSVCRGRFASVYMSKSGKDLKQSYSEQAVQQYKGEPLEGNLLVSITLYHGTHRKTDIDNFNKLWQDSLRGITYLDDSQIVSLTIVKSYDKERPRIEIEINELI